MSKRCFAAYALIAGLSVSSALAGDGSVSLFDEPQKEEPARPLSIPEKKEGFFSFLNFKFPTGFFSSKEEKEPTLEDAIQLADEGNLQAQLFLGYSYLYGTNNAPQDYQKSFEYYSKAAQQKDPTGLNNLGSLYYNGIGRERDTERARALFEQAAAAGNPESAVNLAFIYISGNGAPQNQSKALAYFDQAAEAGNSIAQFMVGYAYYMGALTPQNDEQAARLIKAAADVEFDEAQLVLADMYMKGRGFPQNYSNAVKSLKAAVAQGNTEAMMKLADILVAGTKYTQDIEYAHVLYNLAAVQGVERAADRRHFIESKMKIKDVLDAQLQAENFKEEVSPLTKYVRQTFGSNVRGFFN